MPEVHLVAQVKLLKYVRILNNKIAKQPLWEISEAKGRLPQDGPLWHEDNFEVKVVKTQQIQEMLFTSPTTAWKEI